MKLKGRLIQIIRIVYVIQLVVFTIRFFWGLKVNLNFSELMAWLAVEISLGVPIMFDWLFSEDYAKKIFDSNIERYEREKLEREKAKKLKEIDDYRLNLFEPMVETIKEFQKTSFDASKYNDLNQSLIKIEKHFSRKPDFEVQQARIRLFGMDKDGVPCFTKENLATYLQDIENKIELLKIESRKYI